MNTRATQYKDARQHTRLFATKRKKKKEKKKRFSQCPHRHIFCSTTLIISLLNPKAVKNVLINTNTNTNSSAWFTINPLTTGNPFWGQNYLDLV